MRWKTKKKSRVHSSLIVLWPTRTLPLLVTANYNDDIILFHFHQSPIKMCFVLFFSTWYFRWKSGVASSLNYISIDSKETDPKLIPYPSWSANSLKSDGFSTAETAGGRTNAPKATVVDDGQLADNSSIISTFRIRVDECDRLWVMDTGLVDILGNPKQIAPPALVIFDLNTNKLIKRYTIPGAHIKDDTFFANVVRYSLFVRL